MLTDKQIKSIIKHASRISEKSTFRFKLGAVIFKGNRIISTGYNQNKSHPLPRRHFEFGTIHAEIDALLHSVQSVDGCDIYVFRKNRFGSAMARPCSMCQEILREYGIKTAYFSIKNPPYIDSIKL